MADGYGWGKGRKLSGNTICLIPEPLENRNICHLKGLFFSTISEEIIPVFVKPVDSIAFHFL